MIRFDRLAAVVTVLAMTAGCSRQPSEAPAAAPAPAPAPLRSGIDAAGFDKAVRPQDDLYRYVNGAWLAKTEIPADRGAFGGFYEAIDRTQEQLRAIVEEASKSANKANGSAEQKLGDFFTAFMDEARANAAGKTPLEPELARIDALATKADLARHMARMMMLNMTTLAGGYVDGDAQAPTTSVLYLSQSGLGLPDRDYYLKDEAKLKEYRAEVPRRMSQGCSGSPACRRRTAPPKTSSRSKPALRVRTGRTSRAAMRSRPTTR